MSDYAFIIVESFKPRELSGRHGEIHVRPLPGQDPYLTSMFVECTREIPYGFPVGTKFRIKAKIVQKDPNKTPYIYSHYKWRYEIVE